SVAVTLKDDGLNSAPNRALSDPYSFQILITSINNAPYFEKGPGPMDGTTQPGAQCKHSGTQKTEISLQFHREPRTGRAGKRTDHRTTARP
ncbi:MAG: hypothetical protein ACKO3P_22670, partial [Planctomycetaceae bacterium]